MQRLRWAPRHYRVASGRVRIRWSLHSSLELSGDGSSEVLMSLRNLVDHLLPNAAALRVHTSEVLVHFPAPPWSGREREALSSMAEGGVGGGWL